MKRSAPAVSSRPKRACRTAAPAPAPPTPPPRKARSGRKKKTKKEQQQQQQQKPPPKPPPKPPKPPKKKLPAAPAGLSRPRRPPSAYAFFCAAERLKEGGAAARAKRLKEGGAAASASPAPPLLKGDRVQKLGGFGGGEIGTVVEVNFKGTIALVMSDTGHLFAAQPPQNFKRVPLGDYWEPRAMSRREARGRERAAASLRGAPARLFPPVPVDKKGVQAVAEEEASEAGGEGGGSYFVRSAAPGAAAAKLRLPPRLRPPEPLPALPELPRGVGRISDLQHRLKAREAQRQQQRQQHDRRRQRQEQRFLRAQHQKQQQQQQQQQQRGPSADSIPTGYVPPITAPAPPQRVACIAVDFEEPAVQTIDMRVRLPAMQLGQQQQEEDARPSPNPNIGRSVFG